jgi:hypothetical protein
MLKNQEIILENNLLDELIEDINSISKNNVSPR